MELTRREYDVLKYIYFEIDEIAERLSISTATVKTYLQGLRSKLKCDKRHKIVLRALKQGLIKIDEFITE
jgi:DNA-binding CsgD family transcriptional regulator